MHVPFVVLFRFVISRWFVVCWVEYCVNSPNPLCLFFQFPCYFYWLFFCCFCFYKCVQHHLWQLLLLVVYFGPVLVTVIEHVTQSDEPSERPKQYLSKSCMICSYFLNKVADLYLFAFYFYARNNCFFEFVVADGVNWLISPLLVSMDAKQSAVGNTELNESSSNWHKTVCLCCCKHGTKAIAHWNVVCCSESYSTCGNVCQHFVLTCLTMCWPYCVC